MIKGGAKEGEREGGKRENIMVSVHKVPAIYSGISDSGSFKKGALYVRPLYKGHCSRSENYSPYSSNTLRASEKRTNSP